MRKGLLRIANAMSNQSENDLIRARVTPSARRERVSKEKEVYTIQVREKAERGAATRRARELLAETLGVRSEDLRLVKGATSRHKTFLLMHVVTDK